MKVGDKVRCVDGCWGPCGPQTGAIYRITCVEYWGDGSIHYIGFYLPEYEEEDGSEDGVYWRGIEANWPPDKFKVVKPAVKINLYKKRDV